MDEMTKHFVYIIVPVMEFSQGVPALGHCGGRI